MKQVFAIILFTMITLGDLYNSSYEQWDNNFTQIELQGETEGEKESEESSKKKNIECVNTRYANIMAYYFQYLLSSNSCCHDYLAVQEHHQEIPDPPPDLI